MGCCMDYRYREVCEHVMDFLLQSGLTISSSSLRNSTGLAIWWSHESANAWRALFKYWKVHGWQIDSQRPNLLMLASAIGIWSVNRLSLGGN